MKQVGRPPEPDRGPRRTGATVCLRIVILRPDLLECRDTERAVTVGGP